MELDQIKTRAYKDEDFSNLRQVTIDMKRVFEMGSEILQLKRELAVAVAKEDYDTALILKNRIKELEKERDLIDARYETRRYYKMMMMGVPSDSYMSMVNRMLEEERQRAEMMKLQQDEEAEKYRRQLEELERRRRLEEMKNSRREPSPVRAKQKRANKTEEVPEVGNDPYSYNEGDIDLEAYLRPKLNEAGGQLKIANIEINKLTTENNSLQKEKKTLLETRDKLIFQCNTQSEELISLKSDIDEKYIERIEDADYQIALLHGQIKKLEQSEGILNANFMKNSEKTQAITIIIEEKCKKIEELQEEISELRFKSSINSTSSGENYKEEIYNLKMKNIKLEKMIEDINNSRPTDDDISNMKNLYISQISQIDDIRKKLEKKLKDTENNLLKEKESFQKSQDSFAKQLTGANLEIHNLRAKISELNLQE